MSNLTPRIDRLDGPAVELSFIDAPFTSVVNRSQIPDLATDLSAHAGINRIPIYEIFSISDETGPNGEKVFGAVNDRFNQIRFVGNWFNISNNFGHHVNTGLVDSYVEITFFGTGLNMLEIADATARDWRATVDGGGESGDLATPISNVLGAANWNANLIRPITSGLTLGLHTVKIRLVTFALATSGFEVLNEFASITVNPGTLKGQSIAGHNSLFNGSFDNETGSDVGAGGAVVLYEEDGVIKKDVNWAVDNQLNLAAADHSNEEQIGLHHFREFGAGRSDDFTTGTTGVISLSFTLDDGTTTLVGEDVEINRSDTGAGFIVAGSSDFYTFTFVGTGLDIDLETDLGTPGVHTEFFVDGVSIGTQTTVEEQRLKIVSGLPHGTHTFKYLRTSNTSVMSTSNFVVYGPSKPTLSTGAVVLHEYNLMADFIANIVAGSETVSTGILRKSNFREIVYTNGTGGTTDWVIGSFDISSQTGRGASSDRLNAKFQYTFVGTGFDLRFQIASNRPTDVTVTVDGTALTAANFPGASFSTYGAGAAFNSGTGSLDQNDGSPSQGGFVTSGLPLGKHTVEFNNNNSGSFLRVDTIDIITPIHTPKFNGPFLVQNTLRIGSQGTSDLRSFSKSISSPKNNAKARALTQVTTTTAEDVATNLFCAFNSKNGGPINISYAVQGYNGTNTQSILN